MCRAVASNKTSSEPAIQDPLGVLFPSDLFSHIWDISPFPRHPDVRFPSWLSTFVLCRNYTNCIQSFSLFGNIILFSNFFFNPYELLYFLICYFPFLITFLIKCCHLLGYHIFPFHTFPFFLPQILLAMGMFHIELLSFHGTCTHSGLSARRKHDSMLWRVVYLPFLSDSLSPTTFFATQSSRDRVGWVGGTAERKKKKK